MVKMIGLGQDYAPRCYYRFKKIQTTIAILETNLLVQGERKGGARNNFITAVYGISHSNSLLQTYNQFWKGKPKEKTLMLSQIPYSDEFHRLQRQIKIFWEFGGFP